MVKGTLFVQKQICQACLRSRGLKFVKDRYYWWSTICHHCC